MLTLAAAPRVHVNADAAAPWLDDALLGASGAGKSTLLRLLAGLEPARDGAVWLDDRPVDASGLRHEATLIPQESQLFVGTLAENLTLGAAVDEAALQRALAAALARVLDVQGGACAVVSLHRMALLHLFDEVIVMHDGRVHDSASAEALRARSAVFRQLLGAGAAPQAQPLSV